MLSINHAKLGTLTRRAGETLPSMAVADLLAAMQLPTAQHLAEALATMQLRVEVRKSHAVFNTRGGRLVWLRGTVPVQGPRRGKVITHRLVNIAYGATTLKPNAVLAENTVIAGATRQAQLLTATLLDPEAFAQALAGLSKFVAEPGH